MALDRTTKGVLLGFASFAVFSFSDACVKLIRGQLPPYESAFFGAVFGLTILPFLLRRGDHWIDILSTTNLPLWLVRFLAYPMAEAFVLIFLQPAYITVMSVFFLKERVRKQGVGTMSDRLVIPDWESRAELEEIARRVKHPLFVNMLTGG
jgi:drug/metabolite transporter (DMT)-like permease